MCIFCHSFYGGADGSKEFRFSRADFGPLTFYPLHYDLNFDFPLQSNIVHVTSRQTYRYQGEGSSDKLVLNAHGLNLLSICLYKDAHHKLGPQQIGLNAVIPDFLAHVKEIDGFKFEPVAYEYDTENRTIVITLPKKLELGDEVVIRTVSTCAPNDKELEGIYFDFTPKGAPQTYISQCQQYGFQRIVPCVDTMTSKTFYTTTITADERYTNIISNGDLAAPYFKALDGTPRLTATYHNHKVNMAPYLFFIGVGTYETHISEVEYPSGEIFALELLCLPGVVERKDDAMKALKSLADSIIWVQLSTGAEKCEHEDERREVYKLLQERDILKAAKGDAAPLQAIRDRLKVLMRAWTHTGYTYTGSCYREIGMENSNYGGMENVGNTTILSSRLTPSSWLVDGGYVYMEGVKVHEFYHNINGSQCTGATPFEIWLNEAVTVFIQREREDDIFGHQFMRLGEVCQARAPGVGALACDLSSTSMPIEPAGFNTTHELISAMTYKKAPEFVSMVQHVIGRENFARALHYYHSKFAFSNATSDDWIACMHRFKPEGCDIDLHQMAEGWLKRTGYPIVTIAKIEYDALAKTVTVALTQSGFEEKKDNNQPWIVPIAYALVHSGVASSKGLYVMKAAASSLVINNVQSPPDFVSCACDWSFYGEVKDAASSPEQKLLQAMSDPDAVNRYLAFQTVLDIEKARLVEAFRSGASGLVSVSADFVTLYGQILKDPKLSDAAKGRFLSISSACPSRSDLSHYYPWLELARKAILQAVYAAFGSLLHSTFDSLAINSQLMTRPLKFAVYGAIRHGLATKPILLASHSVTSGGIEAGRTRAASMIIPLLDADNMSDKAFALSNLLELGGAEGSMAQALAKKDWTGHPIGCEQYITCVSSTDCEEAENFVREVISEPFFNISLAGHARSVARGWLTNLHRALLTRAGLTLTKELFLKVGKTNQMSAYGFISSFAEAKKFDSGVRMELVQALLEMRLGLDPKAQESLYNQLGRLLKDL